MLLRHLAVLMGFAPGELVVSAQPQAPLLGAARAAGQALAFYEGGALQALDDLDAGAALFGWPQNG